MQRIKLLVVFAFALVFVAFNFSTSPTVSSQANLSAPTDVTATDGIYSTKVGLRWDTMRGATQYRIFRNTTNDPATAIDLGTTPANTFFDQTAPQGQTFFYWVRSENASTTSGLSQAEQGTRAIGNLGGGLQPLQPPPAPPGNPITATKAYLGKALFWDEQLSSTRTVSCGTCHSGSGGGIDKRTAAQRTRSMNPGFDGIFNSPDDVFGSPGVMSNNLDGTYNWSNTYGYREQVTGRRAMPYTDSAYPNLLFWDGRAGGTFRDPLTNQIVLQNGGALENQILGPPVSDTEMAHGGRNWQQVADRIRDSKPLALATNIPAGLQNWIGGRTYPQLFEEAFGTPEVTPVRIALAIATHERTLFSDQTPFDQVNQGIGTLTAAEQRGANLFGSGVTACSSCHTGNLQTDNGFHYIGVRPPNEDTGRQQVTNNQGNAAQFRTPTLRNVELRGAYFHNGNFTTLRQVVDFYNRGGDFNAPNKDPQISPKGLGNTQLNDLVAFLSRPLTDPRVRNELPPFDHPTLYSESSRVPVLTGVGVAGSGAFVPSALAIEPPIVGNPSFAVGVSNALGGANAVLVIDSNDPGTASIPASGSFTRRQITLAGSGSGNGSGSISLAIPDNAALVGQTFFGRWYVTDASAAGGFAVSQAFRFTIFGEASAAPRAAHVDFDGDRKTDISIFRPSNGQWWYSRSTDAQTLALQFGAGTDKLVPADFSGDGKTDIAVWRGSTGEWFILRSEDNSFYSIPFGAAGDIPVAGDFDADGKADLTIYRPSTSEWFIQTLTQGTLIQQFGQSGDLPQIGDYDGDGKSDLAIYRPSNGQWWIRRSATNTTIAATFGVSTDKPVAQDFSGDGKTDLAFYRPSTGEWFILRSEDSSFYSVPFGTAGDIPAPGDYDGDGKADTAVFRPSTATWYINRSSNGLLIAGFGTTEDLPVPSAFVP
ncbi:MAG TPA: cytochrome c peroxidase [Pyrinomonadaceae bacterium]|nr:cytochrome c peroxidase [Pyrinomonadaceae bacterium]